MVGESGDYELMEQAAVLKMLVAPDVALSGFHPLDGARCPRSLGLDERVASQVADHSRDRVEAAQRGVETGLAVFRRDPPVLTDSQIFCDMTTSPNGRRMPPAVVSSQTPLPGANQDRSAGTTNSASSPSAA